MMIEILIVEDEKPISDLIRLNLMKAGYSCTCAFDGMEAADILEERNFDLIILDVMLPKLNGFELMEYIKPLGIPVIFLTAKATLDDRLRGLTSGAEDYMVKPFEIVELLARVNIVLRRYNKMEQQLTFKDIAIDTKNQNVSKAGKHIELTPKEFELVKFLAMQPGVPVTREVLLEKVWNYEYYGDIRTVDVTVCRIREKLGDSTKNSKIIINKSIQLFIFNTFYRSTVYFNLSTAGSIQ